jgi:hypothetical protein
MFLAPLIFAAYAAVEVADEIVLTAGVLHLAAFLFLRPGWYTKFQLGAAGTELDAIEHAQRRQQSAPPDGRVQAGQLNPDRVASSGQFKDAIAKDQKPIDQQQYADEKPDLNSRTMHNS